MGAHYKIHVFNDSVNCIVLSWYAERFAYITILISAVCCKEDFRTMCSHSEILKKQSFKICWNALSFLFRNKLEEFHTWINRIQYLQFDQDIVAISYYYFLEVEIQLQGINIKLKFIHVIVIDGHIDNNKFLDIYNCEWMHSSLTLQIICRVLNCFTCLGELAIFHL